jgi:cytochrome c oxidase subunit 6c
MADEIGKIPKPQMRGLLNAQIKRNLALTAVTCTLAGLYMKFIFGNGRKNVYAEYYKNYDIEKEFHRIRRKGLFDSCDPYDEADDENGHPATSSTETTPESPPEDSDGTGTFQLLPKSHERDQSTHIGTHAP